MTFLSQPAKIGALAMNNKVCSRLREVNNSPHKIGASLIDCLICGVVPVDKIYPNGIEDHSIRIVELVVQNKEPCSGVVGRT